MCIATEVGLVGSQLRGPEGPKECEKCMWKWVFLCSCIVVRPGAWFQSSLVR